MRHRGEPRFFYPEARTAPGRPGAAGDGAGDWGWADVIQLLIERGHSLADVRGYTLAQVRTFSEAAGRALRRDLVDSAWNLRTAQAADSNKFESYIKALTHG